MPVPEVWTAGTLRRLTNASRPLPMYPRAFLAPNGKLFYAGEARSTGYLDITGTGPDAGGPRSATGGSRTASTARP